MFDIEQMRRINFVQLVTYFSQDFFVGILSPILQSDVQEKLPNVGAATDHLCTKPVFVLLKIATYLNSQITHSE